MAEQMLPEPFADLATNPDQFTNYPGVEEDGDVETTLEGFVKACPSHTYLQKCDSLE